MTFEGQLRKMISENGAPIRYYLNLKDDFIDVNQQLGKKIKIYHDHNECLGCGLDKEIYRMGYCRTCFFSLPQANENIIRPELSTAHLGVEQRDLEWEQQFELQPHIVYLAVSSDLKVGVTRVVQIPTRWIDQGASSAIIMAKTNNRYEAGVIEVAMKEHIADKTNWQKMLKNEIPTIDLVEEKERYQVYIPKEEAQFYLPDNSLYDFQYPVLVYPKKVKSLNLTKQREYEGTLTGIKGQYWMFEDGTVWNVRGSEGFYVVITL